MLCLCLLRPVKTWLKLNEIINIDSFQAISSSTISLFERIKQDLRPIPTHPHYIFTQHDVARVFQGMMLLSSKTKTRARGKARTKIPTTEQVGIAKQTGSSDRSNDGVGKNKLPGEKRYD